MAARGFSSSPRVVHVSSLVFFEFNDGYRGCSELPIIV